MRRREFLRAGLAGLSGLTLPELFARRARAATGAASERTALLVVWLQGGASHLETYDPKPDAPAEIRGPFGSIATKADRRPRQRTPAAPRRGCRPVCSPPFAVAHGVLPPAGQPANVHGTPRTGAQAQARSPRPDVHSEPGPVRSGPPGAGLRGRQPDPLSRPGLPRPRLRAVLRVRRPELAKLHASPSWASGTRRRSTGSAVAGTSRRNSTGFDAGSMTG